MANCINYTDMYGNTHDIDVKQCGTNMPYVIGEYVVQVKLYNPLYGDGRICVCGHTYARHFDLSETNEFVGCKYCGCTQFIENVNR